MAKKDQRGHNHKSGKPPKVLGKSKKSRKRGTVKFFIKDKGYGFINPDGQDLDVFVHYKKILYDGCNFLIEGQKVEFELRQGPRGPYAEAVEIISR